MSIADFRDLIIIIYGILGIFLVLAIIIISFFMYSKVSVILEDVKSISEKAKVLSAFVSKQVVEPLIELSVLIESSTEGIRQAGRIFTGKRRNNNA